MTPAPLVLTAERCVWRLPCFPGAGHVPLGDTSHIQTPSAHPLKANRLKQRLYSPDLCGIIHTASSAHPSMDGETRCGLGENRLRHLNTLSPTVVLRGKAMQACWRRYVTESGLSEFVGSPFLLVPSLCFLCVVLLLPACLPLAAVPTHHDELLSLWNHYQKTKTNPYFFHKSLLVVVFFFLAQNQKDSS